VVLITIVPLDAFQVKIDCPSPCEAQITSPKPSFFEIQDLPHSSGRLLLRGLLHGKSALSNAHHVKVNDKCTRGGVVIDAMAFGGEDGTEEFIPTIMDHDDGTYTIRVTPIAEGSLSLTVRNPWTT